MDRILRGMLLALICFGSFPVKAQGSYDENVNSGLAWLADQQQADGSVATAEDLVSSSTATAEAIQSFDFVPGSSGLNLDDAHVFIGQNGEQGTASLASAILSGITVNDDGQSYYDLLLLLQNEDGGFGSFQGFSSNSLDTARALLALADVKQEHSTQISAAIGFLIDAQSDSGAFRLYLQNEESISVTAIVSASLRPYIFDFQGVAQAVDAANEYLVTVDSSNILGPDWQTAAMLLAVIPTIRDSARYVDYVSALAGHQQADGSWAHDVYSTALAVKALYLATNISFPEASSTGSLSGQFFDLESSAPLENVTVTAALESGENASYNSQPDGRFSLNNLSPGTYALAFQKPGYNGVTQSVSVSVDQVTSLGSIRLQRLAGVGSVSGYVSDAGSGPSLADASLVFSDSNTTVSLSTDSRGYYGVALAPSTYSYSVSRDQYQTISGTVTVNAGGDIVFSPCLFPLGQQPATQSVSISGRIVDADTASGISGAVVQVTGVSDAVASDNLGQFTVDNLSAGVIDLAASAENHTTRQLEILATAGMSLDVGQIALAPSAIGGASSNTLFGTVRDSASGEPIAGAKVSIEGQDLSVTTGANGSFVVSGIDSLDFTAFISAPGYWSELPKFNVSQYGSIQYDSSLVPSNAGGLAINGLTANSGQFSAYTQVEITADLVNDGDVAKSVRLLLQMLDTDGTTIAAIPIESATGTLSPGEPVNVLPVSSVGITAPWYTGISKPGIYTARLRAYDAYTSQILAEKAFQFEIMETFNLSGAALHVNKRFSRVGLEENVELTLAAVNRSNVPATLNIHYVWKGPDSAELRSGMSTITIAPDNVHPEFQLDQFGYQFSESGVYPFTSEFLDSPQAVDIDGATISVAPTVRVDASQTVTPDRVFAGENKKIQIKIQLKGAQ